MYNLQIYFDFDFGFGFFTAFVSSFGFLFLYFMPPGNLCLLRDDVLSCLNSSESWQIIIISCIYRNRLMLTFVGFLANFFLVVLCIVVRITYVVTIGLFLFPILVFFLLQF